MLLLLQPWARGAAERCLRIIEVARLGVKFKSAHARLRAGTRYIPSREIFKICRKNLLVVYVLIISTISQALYVGIKV